MKRILENWHAIIFTAFLILYMWYLFLFLRGEIPLHVIGRLVFGAPILLWAFYDLWFRSPRK